MFDKIKEILLGKSRDPFSKENRRHILLIAFLAWVGLGADGLSSSCYGPELGYLALQPYHHLAIYLALLTAFTVFLIALSYNQVIELFPNGGGGYKVAKALLGDKAGLVSGTALIVDYMLTISISVASGVDAVYSLLPEEYSGHKIIVEVAVVLFLMTLNLRGMKESIKFLLPIFLGFFITHLIVIAYGITVRSNELHQLAINTASETHQAVSHIGIIAVIAILLRAYSLGSGTYTGLEAVSNNVNMLAEPRVRTGRLTMLYMAFSLSLVASGIILLYLLWNVHAVHDMTLNAVLFEKILGHGAWAHINLIILLLLEAGLLLVGGNTGFLGGPAVLSNMAQDDWVPRRFGMLSSRLVKQNGITFFGLSAALIIILSEGSVAFLVILYSINVFITFTISLLGLSTYWWRNRGVPGWIRRLSLSAIGFVTCGFILVVTVFSKFLEGSWIALLITLVLILLFYLLNNYYNRYEALKVKLDKELELPLERAPFDRKLPDLNHEAPTAVFLVKEIGAALHTILWVERMFPQHFKNYVFLSYGQVDTGSFGSETMLNILKRRIQRIVKYLSRFSEQNGIPSKAVEGYGADPIRELPELAKKINKEFPHNVYFASQYIYQTENMLTRLIHSDFTDNLQRQLQNIGIKLMIVPLKLEKS